MEGRSDQKPLGSSPITVAGARNVAVVARAHALRPRVRRVGRGGHEPFQRPVLDIVRASLGVSLW